TSIRIAMVPLIAIFVAAGWYLRQWDFWRPEVVSAYQTAHPEQAIAIFLLTYAATTVIALPTLPLNLAAGLIWGPWWGGLLAAAGSPMGATAAFFSARLFLGQPLARRYAGFLLTWTQREHAANDWRCIAFLRLNPVFPTGLLNYLIGLTAIDARTYVWAT